MKKYFIVLLLLLFLTVSCAEIKYVTKIEKIYRTPTQLVHPKLPRLTLYPENETVFTKEQYRKVLKEYSAYIVFTKQLLMLIKEHNELIEEIEKEQAAEAAKLKEKNDAH